MDRWWERAACLGRHDVVDAATQGVSNRAAWSELMGMCGRCEVFNECLSDAIQHGDWRVARAGMSKRKLHAVVTRRRRVNAR